MACRRRSSNRGDPYQWQVERSAAAIAGRSRIPSLDWRVCYQSRVGPLEWIGPATDAEIARAGAETARPIVVCPIAFVSEHSETLVELDIEYRHLAEQSGVPHYVRVPTVGTAPALSPASPVWSARRCGAERGPRPTAVRRRLRRRLRACCAWKRGHERR